MLTFQKVFLSLGMGSQLARLIRWQNRVEKQAGNMNLSHSVCQALGKVLSIFNGLRMYPSGNKKQLGTGCNCKEYVRQIPCISEGGKTTERQGVKFVLSSFAACPTRLVQRVFMTPGKHLSVLSFYLYHSLFPSCLPVCWGETCKPMRYLIEAFGLVRNAVSACPDCCALLLYVCVCTHVCVCVWLGVCVRMQMRA